MKFFQFYLLSGLHLFFLTLNTNAAIDPSAALPESIDGWNKAAEDREFDQTNLYDYIDGGAELYLSFGFSKVFNRIYSNGEGHEIIVDIFYMNSSYDAFGVFSFSVGEIGNDYGSQSQLAPGAIVFWKDNYYISLFAGIESEESTGVIHKLAKLLDESIADKGQLPPVLKLLPEENLDAQSIRYFRHYIWLNSNIFISNENILNIGNNTQCVTAKYGDTNKAVLIIIQYPDETGASAAFKKFLNDSKYKFGPNYLSHTNEDGWCGVKLIENCFAAVLNAADETAIHTLLTKTEKLIKQ